MDNYKLKKFFAMPLQMIIKKMIYKTYQIIKNKYFRCRDLRRKTFLIENKWIDYSYIDIKAVNISNMDRVASEYLCDMYLDHCFDLLGSGYVNVTYDMNCMGLLGNIYNGSLHIKEFDVQGNWLNKILLKNHLKTAKNIWEHIDKEYITIDWQMDFKSGFRYSQKKWYLNQPIGKAKGVDIKVPWELSRLQHLSQLATFAILFPLKREVIIKEFRNQILDFIMANPLKIGVDWTCTMDVGIRVANMLLAFDILKQLDKFNILDDYFNKIFYSSIYEHGLFIKNNLEWYSGITGNHYLADISGLIFVSAYLRRDEEIDSWLQFSVQEIIEEGLKQFHEDGSNFEASTSYHRLSGELLVYSTSLIYGILNTDKKNVFIEYKSNKIKRPMPITKLNFDIFSNEFFPNEYIKRIYRAALFTSDITKQNENISQIGDNDSGRFFKFSPNGKFLEGSHVIKKYINLKEYKSVQGKYFDENILNHDTFVSATNGLFKDEKLNYRDKFNLEKSIIQSLSKDKILKAEPFYEILLFKNKLDEDQLYYLKYSAINEIKYEDYSSEIIDFNNMENKYYPHFGLFIFKCDNFYLSVMAGNLSQSEKENSGGDKSGHGHNDKLSFELSIAGIDIYIDPGTYLYSPLPELRNKFRSVRAHNVPIIEGEEQNFFTGTFSMSDDIECEIVSYSRYNLILYLTYRDTRILREFKINIHSLIIIDKCNKEFDDNLEKDTFFSSGYGKLMKLHVNIMKTSKPIRKGE